MPKLKALDNEQIASYFTGDPRFGGVYSNDQFYTTVPGDTNKVYILNQQNYNQGGSHWVMPSCLRRHIVYIDSFGFPPTAGITNWAVASGRAVKFNRCDIQALHSDACGYFAIFCAKQLLAGHSEGQLMSIFKDPVYNEQILQQAFSKSKNCKQFSRR
jgi:hypothetical protein